MHETSEIEAMLSEDGWMRRLARGLVADASAADDLVQDLWLTALRRPPAARASRPWLSGALRNLARTAARARARRARYERGAAHDTTAPDPADLVHALRLRREVAGGVLALEEPCRTALCLRFLGGLPLKEVARRTGVSVSTAHARVERGLERLRADLDRAHAGDRRAWSLALAPLARSAAAPAGPAVAAAAGGLAMSTGTKAAAAALLFGAAGLVLHLRSSEGPGAAGSAPAAGAAAPALALELAPPRPVEDARAAVAAPVEPAAGAPPAAAAPLLGLAIDPEGRPLAGARIEVVDGGEVVGTAESDRGGRFELPRAADPAERAWTILPSVAALAGGRLEVRGLATLGFGLDSEGRAVVVAAPSVPVAGVVVGADGAPLPGASATVRVRQDLSRALGLAAFEVDERARTALSGPDGGFRVEDACGGGSVFLDVRLAGYHGREVEIPAAGAVDLEVVLEPLDDAVLVTGRVLDARGAPVEGARVSMGVAIEPTDAEGRFRIRWSLRESRLEADFYQDERGVFRPRIRPLSIAALKPGHGAAVRELGEEDLGREIELRLGEAPLAIAGRVVDAQGEPVAGVAVWEIDPTRFGKERRRQGEAEIAFTTTIEEELRGGHGARTDASGRFEVEGLTDRVYTLRILDPETLRRAPDREVAAGTRGVEITLDATDLARVAGRVVSAGGAPIEGARVVPHRPFEAFRAYVGLPDELQRGVVTDAGGRFDLGLVASDVRHLTLASEGIVTRSFRIEDGADRAALEIVEPLLCEVQVELLDPPEGALELGFLDERGEPLEALESFGIYLRFARRVAVHDGRSGVLRVPETARALAVYVDDAEIARRAVRLDPERRTELRL